MRLILLDRDGIINKLLINSSGETDSPMNINQVEIFPWAPAALKELNDIGFGLAIATNQPAAAKGKVSYKELNDVHNYIIKQASSSGAKILSSHICFHRSEDLCTCRKPKTGLLEEAFYINSGYDIRASWMVGDRYTDIWAGQLYKLNTAWLGVPILDDDELLNRLNIKPTYRGKDLRDFVDFIKKQ